MTAFRIILLVIMCISVIDGIAEDEKKSKYIMIAAFCMACVFFLASYIIK